MYSLRGRDGPISGSKGDGARYSYCDRRGGSTGDGARYSLRGLRGGDLSPFRGWRGGDRYSARGPRGGDRARSARVGTGSVSTRTRGGSSWGRCGVSTISPMSLSHSLTRLSGSARTRRLGLLPRDDATEVSESDPYSLTTTLRRCLYSMSSISRSRASSLSFSSSFFFSFIY